MPRDIPQPDPLRLRVFTGRDPDTDEPLDVEDRFASLAEFVAQLDDRLSETERVVTELVVRDITPEGGSDG